VTPRGKVAGDLPPFRPTTPCDSSSRSWWVSTFSVTPSLRRSSAKRSGPSMEVEENARLPLAAKHGDDDFERARELSDTGSRGGGSHDAMAFQKVGTSQAETKILVSPPWKRRSSRAP